MLHSGLVYHDSLNSGSIPKLTADRADPKAMQAGLTAIILLTSWAGLAQVSPQPAVPSHNPSSPERRALARIKAKMADNLSRLPNYTCLQTIERSHRNARKKR